MVDKGCWSDLVASRSLPIGLTGQSNYTIEGCLAVAAARGYAVAGLSYYGECWAAMGLSYYSTELAASKCTSRCKGNAAETCGGSGALDVYDSTVNKPVQGATNAELATFGPWTYDACTLYLVPLLVCFSGQYKQLHGAHHESLDAQAIRTTLTDSGRCRLSSPTRTTRSRPA